ncbi:hypothetical protein ABZ371_20755 [Streptomyces sp. NPDC005899]|uniref:hypothetical protein n=1 Tax=Streptomyces sp. NPDC005899 TaxID=3155716 RepID=UPI00340137D6
MRDAASRFVVTLLTAILLALQFSGPTSHTNPTAQAGGSLAPSPAPGSPVTQTVSRASTGTDGDAATRTGARMDARTDPGATAAGRTLIPCDEPVEDGDSHGALRSRDRHRTAVGTASESSSRSLVAGDTGPRPDAVALLLTGVPQHTPRSAASPSPAVLQVFRC